MKTELHRILDAVLKVLKVSREVWENPSSRLPRRFTNVKQFFSHVASEKGYSTQEIASALGINRTTAHHHVKQMKLYCNVYDNYQSTVDDIMNILDKAGPYQNIHVGYGYLARSKSGMLTISPTIPEKVGPFWISEGSRPFSPQESFPQITFDSGPMKVKIKVTLEENEKM